MIDSIELHDFKCFPKLSLGFGGLTVLSGANGTGKSTVVQALLALSQSARSGAIGRNRLQLNGPLVEMGTGRDVLYMRSDYDFFSVELSAGGESCTISSQVLPSQSDHTLQIDVKGSRAVLDHLGERLFYLSADRLGPQRSYPVSLDDSIVNKIGRRGEFAPLLYGRTRTQTITNEHLLLENVEKQKFGDVESQFDLWMSRLFPGFRLRTDLLDRLDTVMLGFSLNNQFDENQLVRPVNVGFGVSVAMPIVLAGLLAESGSILIVENPEAHLHPSAQSLIGEFLGRVAAGGAQVFVETHSDHVINGLRLSIKNGVVSSAAVRFIAFTRTDEYGSNNAQLVALNDAYEFVRPPDSFFDQADKDLRLIYGL